MLHTHHPVGDARTAEPSAGARAGRRLVGIDAARGLALLGMVSVHILPAWDPQTFEATAQWTLFSGRAAALFALLAGVGLALGSGGTRVHEGRRMTADRAGLLVRAVLVAVLGLLINQLSPGDPPAYNILVYYGMFFLLALPFLHLSVRALLAWAAGLAVLGPVLVHSLGPVLPVFGVYNPGFAEVLTEPGTTLAQLLVTGSYPGLTYLVYLLAGMALGRLDLSAARTQIGLLLGGAALAAASAVTSWLLLHPLGGIERLLAASPFLGREDVRDVLVYGPDPVLPTSTWWWLAVTGPHTNTPPALLSGVGTGVLVLGLCLLVARRAQHVLLPLVAAGSMTLTLYSAHLLGLFLELHYEQPVLWFLVHVLVGTVLAVLWRRARGQGPLERLVGRSAHAGQDLVLRHRLNS
ncbi:heparan-alpha-glucosaminide N-acetyltransferase domain-containing protein [Kocuria rhizosphaericola]|uniref:heparan-alpha-glucosaminide N-acetyltransferase domain-containing protein n=1 Tax=Kocuria rhizosphaericola TaxID=3376284 RepID=UPI003791C5F8